MPHQRGLVPAAGVKLAGRDFRDDHRDASVVGEGIPLTKGNFLVMGILLLSVALFLPVWDSW
jgi:hypothetical protein